MATITLTGLPNNLILQRDATNRAVVKLAGTVPTGANLVTFTATPRWGKLAVARSGRLAVAGNGFSAGLTLNGGMYDLLLIAYQGTTELARVSLYIGVGEVFLAAGHSVVQGDSHYPGNGPDPALAHVFCVAIDATQLAAYSATAKPADLPDLLPTAYVTGLAAAPFGSTTNYWAWFGQHVADALDVPVLVFNTGFGGSSLEHWAKSARGESFTHMFINSALRFPYINLRNALTKYIAVTGLRAILSDNGQNDTGRTDSAAIAADYRAWIAQARLDSGFASLPVVVNRQTPFSTATYIRTVQEQVATDANNYPGPDYDAILESGTDRYDGIHLTQSGLDKAATAWASVVTQPAFLSVAKPLLPNPAPALSATVATTSLTSTTIDQPKRTALTGSLLTGMALMALLWLAGLLIYRSQRPVVG